MVAVVLQQPPFFFSSIFGPTPAGLFLRRLTDVIPGFPCPYFTFLRPVPGGVWPTHVLVDSLLYQLTTSYSQSRHCDSVLEPLFPSLVCLSVLHPLFLRVSLFRFPGPRLFLPPQDIFGSVEFFFSNQQDFFDPWLHSFTDCARSGDPEDSPPTMVFYTQSGFYNVTISHCGIPDPPVPVPNGSAFKSPSGTHPHCS